MKTINWIKIEDQLPEYGKPVLLIYEKRKQSRGGNIGWFVTQGVFIKTENKWRGDTWEDYTNRQIQDVTAKTSKNKVLGWIYLPENNFINNE